MHDARLGRAFFFLDVLAEHTLLSMTIMVTPSLRYVVGMNFVMSHVKFPQVGVCPPVLQNMCCASRFYMGGGGAVGSRSK